MAPTVDLDSHYKVKGYAPSMLIGQLADVADLATQTIRFYERSGLLPAPLRDANGYRVYDDTALNRPTFIRASELEHLLTRSKRLDPGDCGDAPCRRA
jgi:MerR family transcriptional regulator, mercuric resistance operon regulatory protein